uniref:Uncharacterized protein n=1 Tax=viral metagenome TaxID=1070528 RepID=A0A6C0JAN2_9ZZZZ
MYTVNDKLHLFVYKIDYMCIMKDIHIYKGTIIC